MLLLAWEPVKITFSLWGMMFCFTNDFIKNKPLRNHESMETIRIWRFYTGITLE